MAQTLLNLSRQAQGLTLNLGKDAIGDASKLTLHVGSGSTSSTVLESKGSISIDGNVILQAPATAGNHAVSKTYVDTLLATKLEVTGTPFAGAVPVYDTSSGNVKWGMQGDQNGYDTVYFVTNSGNDATAVPNLPTSPYKLIKTATAAAATQVAAGKRVLVYVAKGVYKEANISRDKVDMYFEKDAIAYTDSVNNPVLSDWTDNKAITLNVYGKGRFYHKNSKWDSDEVGLNFMHNSTINIEADVVDGCDMWSSGAASSTFKGTQFLFHFGLRQFKTHTLIDCKFMSGFGAGIYTANDCKVKFQDCEFILPKDVTQYNNVYDGDGNLAFTINNQNFLPTETSGMTQSDVINITSNYQYRTRQLAAIDYTENLFYNRGDQQDNLKLEFIDPVIRVRKSNGAGIRAVRNYENAGASLILKNPVIIDETIDKKSIGIIYGKKSGLSDNFDFNIEGLSTNVQTLSGLPAGFENLKETYRTLEGKYVDDKVANAVAQIHHTKPMPLTGVKDGVNKVFTFSEDVVDNTMMIYVNGMLQSPFDGGDYVYNHAGKSVTFDYSPDADDRIVAYAMY
jgi:hypothetical protein